MKAKAISTRLKYACLFALIIFACAAMLSCGAQQDDMLSPRERILLKDRFYLYLSRWRQELPMVHILPHWNWPERLGEITPVHVFTTGDEVELFLNGKSKGRKKKGDFEYRLRWDDILYEAGELKAVAHRNGKKWAEGVVQTTGEQLFPYK